MAGELAPTTALSDALVILGAAGIVIPAFARFRITPIIGFILVGVLVGPYGLGAMVDEQPWLYHITITDPEAIKPFAEFGIILLLFSIGLELSFNRLWAMRKLVFGLGPLELFITAVLIGVALMFMGQSFAGALGLGLALALSSTALALPIAGTTSPVGKAALAMLLFEDIALVPIIFLLGAMAPAASSDGGSSLFSTLWMGTVVIAVMLLIGRYALPTLFAQAARTKSPELFLAASLLVVIASALATSYVGLSPIFGALLAGLLIAETEYHGEVEHITAPFKGLALGVFLITVGMSIDLAMVVANIWPLMLAVVGVVLLKALVTSQLLLRFVGMRRGVATEAGLLLASPSETTLIVLSAASAAQLIMPSTAQFWQIVTAIGLTITPLLAKLGHDIARRIERREAGNTLGGDADLIAGKGQQRTVIFGFGRVGQLVADMLTKHGQPYLAVESDIDAVEQAQKAGYAVIYGDAGGPELLDRLQLGHAKALILTMNEPVLAAKLVRKMRGWLPDLPIIARARDSDHAAQLYRAGASHAVPDTLEASLQLSEAVLVDIGVPMGPVIASIHEKRDQFRAQIMVDGELDEKPRLKTRGGGRALRDAGQGIG